MLKSLFDERQDVLSLMTHEEKALCERLDGWIARDRGGLFWYNKRPEYKKEWGMFQINSGDVSEILHLDEKSFQFILEGEVFWITTTDKLRLHPVEKNIVE